MAISPILYEIRRSELYVVQVHITSAVKLPRLLNQISPYPGGRYVLQKTQLKDKQGQNKDESISMQQSQHQVILHSPSPPQCPCITNNPWDASTASFFSGQWENEAQGR